MKSPIPSDARMTVPKSVSLRRSGSLGGGGFGVGGEDAAMTGGTGGRRDEENSGRARVSCNALRGTPHKGLPVNELACLGRAGVTSRLTAGGSRISRGAFAVTPSNPESVSVRASEKPAKAATSSVAAPQVRHLAGFGACPILAIAQRSLRRRSRTKSRGGARSTALPAAYGQPRAMIRHPQANESTFFVASRRKPSTKASEEKSLRHGAVALKKLQSGFLEHRKSSFQFVFAFAP